jgi:HlyD family secretion protein
VLKRLLKAGIAVAIVIAAGVGLYAKLHEPPPPPEVIQAAVTEGDVIEGAISTGTIQALRTVDIGAQVSGTVQHLYADFNSIVKQGQLVAQIDPSLMQQTLDSANASVELGQINLAQDQNVLAEDQLNATREQKLLDDTQATEQERDDAVLTVKADQAKINSDKDAIEVAQANVHQAEINLAYCTIRSPIDGVVIARNVDEGQTVASSFAAPTLFTLATDLTTLQLIGDVDEADVARIRPKQDVVFTVDAYPGTKFHATVTEVRLNATTTNNVVTYQVVSRVENPELRLLPGMTANLTVQISRASDATRVPMQALRFHPTKDMFDALGLPAPPPARLAPPKVPQVVVTGVAPKLPAGENASVIDTMFAPIAPPVSTGQVWVERDGQIVPLSLTIGVSDGTWAQLLNGDLKPGDQVLTSIILPVAKSPAAAGNPLVQQPNRGRGAIPVR